MLSGKIPSGGTTLQNPLSQSVGKKKWNEMCLIIAVEINGSVKYSGLVGCASLTTFQQCPKYLNKVLITYISESSISVIQLITLSVSSSCSHSLLSLPYPAWLY